MNIEQEIFKRSNINLDKLKGYGFKKENGFYIYEKEFMNSTFKAVIIIDKDKNVTGKVIDLLTEEEYININTEMSGEFINSVRDEYKNILNDIKQKCFETNYFINKQTNRITKFIKDKYNTIPEFMWSKFPTYGVFRNKISNKWFGIIMNIDNSKLDKNSNGEVEVLNIKLGEDTSKYLKKKGFYESYHMNKKNWVSVILDDTLEDSELINLIDISYKYSNEKKEKLGNR